MEKSGTEIRRGLRERLKIDPLRLDEALVEHSSLVHRVNKETALAQSRLDRCKDDLARLEATLATDIRKKLLAYQTRVTEAELRERLHRDRGYQQTTSLVLTARREHGLWEALQEAFKQRSFMLRSLVDLYTADYYNTQADSISRNARYAEHTKRQSAVTEDYYKRGGGNRK